MLSSLGRRTVVTIINQGHEGWRLSFGRNPTKLTPGLRLFIPFYHTIQVVDTRETSVAINELGGFTADNVPVVISGSLFYRVRDSYNACFSVHDFQTNVKNIGTSAMRSVVGHFTYDDVVGDRNKINMKLHDTIGNTIEKWGVDCTRFEVQNFKPHNREVEKQLELQMQAERERRKQLLDTQAQVNVAEGQKQRTILESEGELQSQLNRAEGEKRGQILKSEGFLQASINEGVALARQIDSVAEALTLESGEKPTAEIKLKALDALLQLRRLEQLKAIAEGEANSTYFFGDESRRTGSLNFYDVDNAEKWKQSLRERMGSTISS
ncbi:stomatin family protein [Hysterangium stoloniferum]|nr:stomatin family protein [Hysterangium stoloniferum]